MSKVWQASLVKEFSTLTAGGTPSTTNGDYWEKGTIPWLSSGEVHKKRVRYADGFITKEGLRNSAAKLVPPKTILVALAGQGKTRGTVAITEIETTTNQSIASIIPSDEICHADFLFHNLDSRYTELRSISGGAGRAGLNLEILGNVDVQLPPLPEQKKIAAILTSVDDVIENTQKQIDKLQDLKKATMNELLAKGIGHTEFKDSELGRIPKSWEVVPVSELLKLKNGLNTNADAFGSGTPFLAYKDVYMDAELNEHSLSKRVTVNPREAESFSVNYGDVFFTRTSETPEEIGFANTYLGKNIGVVFNGFCIRGRPTTEKLSARLSRFLFRSDYVRVQMKFLCKYTTRAGISGESLARCLIAIPPIEEQDKCAEVLHSIENLVEESNEKLEQIQSLKKALMQDLLTGKVRVQLN